MPRPPEGRVGRSAGVAEHRVVRHRFFIRLSRTTTLTRLSALGLRRRARARGRAEPRSPRRRAPTRSRRHRARDRRDRGAVVRRPTPGRRPRPPDRDAQQASSPSRSPRSTGSGRSPTPARCSSTRATPTRSATSPTWSATTPSRSGAVPRSIGAGQRQRPGRDRRSSQSSIADLDAQRTELRDARARAGRRPSHELSTRRQTLDAQLASLEQRASATAADVGRATTEPRGRRDRDDRRADPQRDVVALTVAPRRPSPPAPPRRPTPARSARTTTTRSSCAPGRVRATATTPS